MNRRRSRESADGARPAAPHKARRARRDPGLKSSSEICLPISNSVIGAGAIGIDGVLAYMVGQRKQEIGIRMALGAERGAVLRLILRRGIVLITIGIS